MRNVDIFVAHLSLIRAAIGDLVEVTDYLLGLQNIDIYHLGLTLGLNQPHLKEMKNSEMFRDDVIAAWLKKEDQVLKRGIPTWKNLAKALRDPRMNQAGIATQIETDKKIK